MSPLPKDDSAPRQVAACRLKEEPNKKIETKPKPRCSAKGLRPEAAKKAGPGKPSQLEAVSNERGKVQLNRHMPADYGVRPVRPYVVEQKLEHRSRSFGVPKVY